MISQQRTWILLFGRKIVTLSLRKLCFIVYSEKPLGKKKVEQKEEGFFFLSSLKDGYSYNSKKSSH